jgi:hypothetical protein
MAQNQAVESPGAFIKLADGTLSKVGPTHVGPTAPNSTPAGTAGNSVGETWLNTSLTKPVLNVWNGVEWVKASSSGSGCWVGDAPPTEYEQGSLWWNSSNGTLYVWYDDGDTQQWVEAGPGGGGSGGDFVPLDSATGAAYMPTGDTVQRPAAPVAGMVRLNTDTSPQLENYAGGTWQPIGVIASNLTLNVATTGSDTTGLGTTAAPWATPHKAMAYLSNYQIAQGVTVTVSVADGVYTFTTPLVLNHPNGSQIAINGGSTSGTRPNVSLTGGNAVGNTAATLAANDALLNAYYNTKWQFNGCNGLVCTAGGGATLNTLLIRGDASPGSTGVFCGRGNISNSGSVNLGTTVAVHNFGAAGLFTNFGGSIWASFVTVTNMGGNGVATNFGGQINFNAGVASNCGASGLFTSFFGCISANNVQSSYHSQNGAFTSFGGDISLNTCFCTNNGGVGVFCNYGGIIDGLGTTASDNASYGFRVFNGGSLRAQNATAFGNGETDIMADKYGVITVAGAAYGTLSPAINTTGNGNAYISS